MEEFTIRKKNGKQPKCPSNRAIIKYIIEYYAALKNRKRIKKDCPTKYYNSSQCYSDQTLWH